VTCSFLRILKPAVGDKARALRAAVADVNEGSAAPGVVFAVRPDLFRCIRGSPFAYWVRESFRRIFLTHAPLAAGSFNGESGRVRRVATTTSPLNDNFRFARLHWEVSTERGATARWCSWSKGGAYSPYHYDPDTVICWDDGRGTYPGFLGTPSRPLERPASADLFFRPALTWPLRTDGLSFRVLPRGGIFGAKGGCLCVRGDSENELLAWLAVVNSQAFAYLVSMQLARTELAQSYEVGLIQRTPVPELSRDDIETLAPLAKRAWSLMRRADSASETSHAFLLPAAVSRAARVEVPAVDAELAAIQQEVDSRVAALYGLDAADREAVNEASREVVRRAAGVEENEDDDDDTSEDFGVQVWRDADLVASWLVGVAFGRFDVRLASSERSLPLDPGPFDELPLRSPAMFPVGEEPADSPGILVCDDGHPDDVVSRLYAIAERLELQLADGLRSWVSRDFFPLHVRMYSRSRRKAPIYWQLATPSASYSVWLYVHAFNKDTLFRVQNDYVGPKLAHEDRRLESMKRELRAATASQRKEVVAQETFVEELRVLLEEVKRVAPLWDPYLDDGVIINFAPLWRLVPHSKAWQKELKATWDALCDGEYDWAHLAMHLWPERVVPKCAKDRSLAIAHRLENVFWVDAGDSKWTSRKTPTKRVDELVNERSSPAVKSALQSLLEAPAGGGKSAGGKVGGRRKAAASANRGDV
jgi:hypothetical protein